MYTLTFGEILKEGKVKLKEKISLNRTIHGISIDTRTLKRGDLFFALKGEQFDGHKFLKEAEKKGAAAAVVKQRNNSLSLPQFVSSDVVFSLGNIARYIRSKWKGDVIAVCGSNGKTTTKNMLHCLLSEKFSVVSSPASYNNFCGVPLTMQLLNNSVQLCIQEMETNQQGGIMRLCDIARPKIGIVTNIGYSHLESLKTLYGVFKEKSELILNLPAGGTAVLNYDDNFYRRFLKKAKGIEVISYGLGNRADFRAKSISFGRRGISFNVKGQSFRIPTFFMPDVYNALASLAVASGVYGISLKQCAKNLKNYKPLPLRSEVKKIKGRTFILDCFNANPSSFSASVENLRNFSHKNKHILVGDMLELGKDSPKLHRYCGEVLAASCVDKVFCLGSMVRWLIKGLEINKRRRDRIFYCKNRQEAVEFLRQYTRRGDLIMVKGSRSLQLEKIIQAFAKRDETSR